MIPEIKIAEMSDAHYSPIPDGGDNPKKDAVPPPYSSQQQDLSPQQQYFQSQPHTDPNQRGPSDRFVQTTEAQQFRSTTHIPDPNTKSGKLYAKMAAVVGQDNICPIPVDLTDEEDKKLWLKSDSNSLLYFFYKSPQARIAVQKEIDTNCCYHAIHTSEGNCRPQLLCECCISYAILVIPPFCCTPCLCPSTSQHFTRDRITESRDSLLFASRMYYRDASEYYENVPLQTRCGEESILAAEAFKYVYDHWFYQPIVNAGFNFPKSSWTSSQCCLSVRELSEAGRHKHIYNTWAKFRYGNKARKDNFNTLNGTATLVKYRQDCLNDMTHPHFKQITKPQSPSNHEPDGWIGQREVAPDNWETQIPLADLNLKELSYVVETHNKKWGSIKPLNPASLDLNYIFPGQSP